jgi:hypothetical protein
MIPSLLIPPLLKYQSTPHSPSLSGTTILMWLNGSTFQLRCVVAATFTVTADRLNYLIGGALRAPDTRAGRKAHRHGGSVHGAAPVLQSVR